MASVKLPTVMVLHANHAQEFDADVKRACAQLQQAGVRLFNQSVLLKGVNDSVAALGQDQVVVPADKGSAISSHCCPPHPLCNTLLGPKGDDCWGQTSSQLFVRLAVTEWAWLDRLVLQLGDDAEIVSSPSQWPGRSMAAQGLLARYGGVAVQGH